MADQPAAPKNEAKSLPDLGGELVALVLAYIKQETLLPLKALGRYVAFGLAGGILLSFGCVLAALAIVRTLQNELTPHLTGHLTWVPYCGGLLFVLLVAALAASRIGKVSR